MTKTCATNHVPGVLYVNYAGAGRREARIAGGERMLLALIEHFHPDRFRCSVVCDHPVLRDECLARGAEAIVIDPILFLLPLERPNLDAFAFAKTVRAIRRFAKAEQANLIHANNVHPTQASFVAAKSLGIPVVAHIRGKHFLASRHACFMRWCNAVLAVSRAMARDYWPKQMGSRLRIIHDGIDPAPFLKIRRRRYPATHSQRDLVVGTAAFLRKQKGLDDFIRVAALARRARWSVRFVIAGAGPEEHALRGLAKSLGLAEVVTFLGHVDDMAGFLAGLDVFLAPSRSDALPGSVIQAGAAGLPCVVSDAGGMPEIVENGVTGFVVPVGDAARMWRKVRRLLKDQSLREAMGRRARHRVCEKFSVSRYVESVAGVYESLLPVCRTGTA